jgi:hypothetical protein
LSLLLDPRNKNEIIALVRTLLEKTTYPHLKPDQVAACTAHIATMMADRRDMDTKCEFGTYTDGRTVMNFTFSFRGLPR